MLVYMQKKDGRRAPVVCPGSSTSQALGLILISLSWRVYRALTASNHQLGFQKMKRYIITVTCIARSMDATPPHYRSLLIGPIYTYYRTYHSFPQCLYCLLSLYTCINAHLFVQYSQTCILLFCYLCLLSVLFFFCIVYFV